LIILAEVHNTKGFYQGLPFLNIRDSCDAVIPISCIGKIFDLEVTEEKFFFESTIGSLEKLVEDMVIPFTGVRLDNPGLLQEIPVNVSPRDLARTRELNSDEFSKT
jgi:hypothetical protein